MTLRMMKAFVILTLISIVTCDANARSSKNVIVEGDDDGESKYLIVVKTAKDNEQTDGDVEEEEPYENTGDEREEYGEYKEVESSISGSNQLRKRNLWKSCMKKTVEVCRKACRNAYKDACSYRTCSSKLKTTLKKECKSSCKSYFADDDKDDDKDEDD